MFSLLFGQVALGFILLRFLAWPLYAYQRDRKRLRRFPSVSCAGITDAWGVLHQYLHTRTRAVHEAHRRHGAVVRVGTEHLSFASLQAIRDIYGHGTPTTKDNFYRAFVSTHLNISDAQDKAVHSVKRRRFAAALAQKSIVQLEDAVGSHLKRLVRVLDRKAGEEVDMKRVLLHLMYDVISTMMYAQDPNFLESGSTVTTAEAPSGRLYKTDMYQSMIDSARVATSAGWAPRATRLVRFLTQWHPGWASGDGLRDVTIHFVRNRLRMDMQRIEQGLPPLDDLMSTMFFDRDGNALGLELGELVTEAQNMFNAAGENTEIAATNVVWLLARTPRAAARLREELDGAFDRLAAPIPRYDDVKDLPYLRACIDEALRLRPSIEGGLPRLVPPEGMRVDGMWLEGGTTVSVSTHTVHRDSTIFHEDPDEYVPERWLRDDANAMQRGFLAFSQGGRACIGRNIAYFEMALVVALLFSRYDFVLRSPGWELGIDENFSAHTKPFPVKVLRRDGSTAQSTN
ncbi:Cytochrome P450 [Pleurostoma richardsiae]|uniref:Cytochrome P450 n=1 Tax=Pleurostoma richardsiae TaxID=41990 RepID=A0AA38R531_9PEZI|nr:Cytochrome P450 [Pleurostoma richardsiae]